MQLFEIDKLQYIDLSDNNLNKLGAQIGKKLRDEITHIKWIDLTQNDFFHDTQALSMIIQGLKKQVALNYVGLSVSGLYCDQIVRLLQPRRPPLSLNLRNSTLNDKSVEYLAKAISNSDNNLSALSLKYCYLTFEHVHQLAKALRFNRSLVKLDLSHNALKFSTTKYLLESCIDNVTLVTLDLSGNFLDDQFAEKFAEVL